MPLRLTDTVSFPVESFAAAVTYCGSMHFSRNFILGFLTFFSFLLAFFALAPALPVYLALLGSNAETIGLLVGIFSVSSLFSRFLAGSALRRYSEKSLIMFSSLLFAITFLGCTLLRPFWPFLAVRLVQGVTYAFLDTAVFAWLFKVTPPAHRGRLLGYFMLAPGLAMVMAPSFGMFLANSFSFVILFLWCMGLSLCALLFSGRLKSGKIEKVAPVNRMLRNSFLERKIIAPGMVGFFYNFVLGSIMAFFPLYAIKCGVVNPGHFFSAAAAMTIAGRLLGGKVLESWGNEKIIQVFSLASMVALLIVSSSRTLPMFIVAGALWGAGGAFMFPVSMAYALDYAGSSAGTAVGTFRALMDLGLSLGPIVMGMIIPSIGYPPMFLFLAAICLVNLCYFQFYVRRRRNTHGIAAAAA